MALAGLPGFRLGAPGTVTSELHLSALVGL